MAGADVAWVGCRPPHKREVQALARAGHRITGISSPMDETQAPLPQAADVVVLSLGPKERVVAETVQRLSVRVGHAPIVALVEHKDDVLPAISAGADDAVCRRAGAEALGVRLHVWARSVAALRGGAATLAEARLSAVAKDEEVNRLRSELTVQKEAAHRDDLTGLGSRRAFEDCLDRAVEVSRRYGGAISVMVADLDGMKQVNDDHGAAAGDDVLRRIADALTTSVRAADIAARLGGDEFAVVMPATDRLAATKVAERLRARVEQILLPNGVTLSASIGVASMASPRGVGVAADDLLARADAALYLAKRRGKNRVVVDGSERIRAA